MGDPRNPSSWNSIRSYFRGSESHVLPSASKIRRRSAGLVGAGGARGAGGAGGAGGKQLLVRFLVRSITNPRALVLGLVTFVMAPSLYFFSRSADWKQEPGAGRLAEPQGLALDFDHGPHHQLPTPGPPPTLQDQHQPPPTRRAADKQATERAPADRTTPSGKRRPPPLLPAEVFRDVPPEECLTSPLWERRVDPDEYEFGCKEIERSHGSTEHESIGGSQARGERRRVLCNVLRSWRARGGGCRNGRSIEQGGYFVTILERM